MDEYEGWDFTKSNLEGTFPATLQATRAPRSRVEIPLWFAIRFVHDSFAVMPSGVTAPRPVITTLLRIVIPNREDRRKKMNRTKFL